jgi:hypothetical protein
MDTYLSVCLYFFQTKVPPNNPGYIYMERGSNVPKGQKQYMMPNCMYVCIFHTKGIIT